tara:strand:- start:22456 stop:24897 length:2442 start_codon:yes stop_codon:yes gene_type:complete
MTRGASSLAGGLTKIIAPLVSVATAAAALKKAVTIQRQFDVLNAGLITATGNSEKAAQAFQALQDFAAKTPYSLDQAVEGFTKLVNLGLTPSEKALTSYGNTASAMGKDLNQMIEAVADAATGEFERLKEFGIKSKKNGDQISFTFQGVTKTVGSSAAEIERYLTDLGENQFAGAMELRMDTLDGAISNLGDTWDTTFRLINDAGLGDVMQDTVNSAIDALSELNDQIASGQLGASLSAVAGKFDGFGKDIETTLGIISELFVDETGYWSNLLKANIANMTATFSNFPENVRAFIQIMTVEVLAGFDMVKAYARAFNDGINAIFTNDTWQGVGARLEAELSIAQSARQGSITSIVEERDTALASFDSQIDAAGELRRSYEELRKEREAGKGDRLEEFGIGGSGNGSSSGASTSTKLSTAEKEAKRVLQLYARTEESLNRQIALYGNASDAAALRYDIESGSLRDLSNQQKQRLVLLQDELDARNSIKEIQNINLELLRATGQEQAARNLQFELEYAEKIAEYERQGNVEALQRLQTLKQIRDVNGQSEGFEGLSDAPRVTGLDASVGGATSEIARLDEEAQALEEWRSKELERQTAFLEAKAINEEDYNARITEINRRTMEGLAAIEESKNTAILQSSGEFFGNMAVLSQSGNKKLGAVGKAAAIAQATISGFTAIQNALAVPPYPVGLALAVSAGVVTAANIASIAGVGFRQGGYTGSGGVDDVAGVVHGKEFVFDAGATARIGVQNLEAMRKGQPAANAPSMGSAGNTYNNYNMTSRPVFTPGMTDSEMRRSSSAAARSAASQLRSLQRHS